MKHARICQALCGEKKLQQTILFCVRDIEAG